MKIVDDDFMKELEAKKEDGDNVIDLSLVTSLNIDPDQVLVEAVGKLDTAIVIGYDKEGWEFFSSSTGSGPEVLWLLERFKKALLEVMDTDV